MILAVKDGTAALIVAVCLEICCSVSVKSCERRKLNPRNQGARMTYFCNNCSLITIKKAFNLPTFTLRSLRNSAKFILGIYNHEFWNHFWVPSICAVSKMNFIHRHLFFEAFIQLHGEETSAWMDQQLFASSVFLDLVTVRVEGTFYVTRIGEAALLR